MPRMRRFRLWRSRWFGPPVGVWQTETPVARKGYYCAWRILLNGGLDYRLLTDEETEQYLQMTAW